MPACPRITTWRALAVPCRVRCPPETAGALCYQKPRREPGTASHENHDLHRGPAADRPPQGAARVLRICRRRLLFRADTCAPTAPISKRIKLRQRILVDVADRSTATTILGEPASLPLALAPIGLVRHAARRRRDPGLPRRAGGGNSVHAVDHVDLFDRGCRGGGRQAVLVPALRHEGSRLHPRTDRARGRGQMQRAGAHGRSASARPAPPRHQERHDRAAGDSHQEPHRHRHQAGLGAERVARQAQDVRQHRRPRPRHGKRHSVVASGLPASSIRR